MGSSKSGAGATWELSRNLKPQCGSAATGTGSALSIFGAWVCWLCENSLVSRGSTCTTAWVSVCTLSSSEARGSMATIAGGFFLCCAKASQRPAREATPRAGKSEQPRGLGGRTKIPHRSSSQRGLPGGGVVPRARSADRSGKPDGDDRGDPARDRTRAQGHIRKNKPDAWETNAEGQS